MKSKANQIHVEIKGVNLNRIFLECQKNNIELFNVNRKDYKNLEFDVHVKDRTKLNQIVKNGSYDYSVSSKFGFEIIKNQFFLHFGIILGFLLFVILNFFSSFFVWDIKIYGNNRIEDDVILNVLKQNSVERGKPINIDAINTLENSITNQIEDISLCSVILKGTTVIINVKEKLFIEEIDGTNENDDIVATKNLTITKMIVVNGTAQKKVGDSVQKGEVIVAGFVLDANGGKVPCKANASIEAKTWHTATNTYQKEIIVSARTGKTASQTYMSLFGMKFNVKQQPITFENFEEETIETIISNNFLPLKMITKTFYEITQITQKQNFELDKQDVLLKTQKQAGRLVENGEQITNIFDVISEEDDCFIITSYVEVLFQI